MKNIDLTFLFSINIIFYVTSCFLGVERVFFNIDYFLCFYILYFGYKWLSFLLLFIILSIDCLLIIRQIFPFFKLNDILYILKFIFIASEVYKYIFISIILSFLISGLYLIKIKTYLKNITFILFLLSIIYFIESIYGLNKYKYENKLVDSSIKNFVILQFDGFVQTLNASAKNMVILPIAPATSDLYQDLSNKNLNNKGVLLIIAESLGVPKNDAIIDELLTPIKNKVEKLSLQKASYVMPTVYAEFRELCHAEPQNFNLTKISTKISQYCLPFLYKEQGYDTTSIHGALGVMYNRKDWYPQIGFDKSLFFESKSWNNRCYSFPGACDIEVIEEIPKLFKNTTNPQFVYWLTLNSHAIYDKRDILLDVFNCKKFSIVEDTESCRNLKLQAQFFYSLGEIFKKPEMKGIKVIIVGDHTPILFKKTEKDQYFDESNVLILTFKVK